MFDHRYEETIDPDHPGGLVISLPSLSIDVLSALPDYLVSSISDRLDPTPESSHLGARPLIFEVEQSARLSERAIWNCLIEFDNASAWVANYCDAAIALSNSELLWSSAHDMIGQEPLYAYIDRWFRRRIGQVSKVSKEDLDVVDAFERFLQACDMDHEVHQHDYITVVYQYLWSEPERAADFIAFRLTSGQQTDIYEPINWALLNRGMLKLVIDRVLKNTEVEWMIKDLVLEFCAVVYGSNEQVVQDVIDYCKKTKEFDDDEIDVHQQRKLNELRSIRDSQLDGGNWFPDTGFHVFNKEKRVWELRI